MVDSNTQEITNYCLPGLLTLLTNTTSFVHEVQTFFKAHLFSISFSIYSSSAIRVLWRIIERKLPVSKLQTGFCHWTASWMYTFCIYGYIQVLTIEEFDYNSNLSVVIIYFFSVNLLCPSTVIEPTWHARKQMAYALANQFFGCFITMQSWFAHWTILKFSFLNSDDSSFFI